MKAPLSERFARLGRLLADHGHLWRPAPFHHPRPDWLNRYPALEAPLMALSDTDVASLAQDDEALFEWVGRHEPDLADTLDELADLVDVDVLPACMDPMPPGRAIPRRLLAHVPGRKQAQIEAFSKAVGKPSHPLLEWCAGKGHLGRVLAWWCDGPVLSLEIDAGLVEAGQALAARSGLGQTFVRADALDPGAASALDGRHAVALHACGDLHGVLLREAVARKVPALDLSPCCYYRIATPRYQPFCPESELRLSRDELHLAVTETATAGTRERKRAAVAAAWKLAFLEWRATAGIDRALSFAPVPDNWQSLGFGPWMTRLCLREGLGIPPEAMWTVLESSGWVRHRQVVRHDLMRFVFRRALEMWLVLDRAVFLERAGYAVAVGVFCSRSTSPRNLLIRARLN